MHLAVFNERLIYAGTPYSLRGETGTLVFTELTFSSLIVARQGSFHYPFLKTY